MAGLSRTELVAFAFSAVSFLAFAALVTGALWPRAFAAAAHVWGGVRVAFTALISGSRTLAVAVYFACSLIVAFAVFAAGAFRSRPFAVAARFSGRLLIAAAVFAFGVALAIVRDNALSLVLTYPVSVALTVALAVGELNLSRSRLVNVLAAGTVGGLAPLIALWWVALISPSTWHLIFGYTALVCMSAVAGMMLSRAPWASTAGRLLMTFVFASTLTFVFSAFM